MDVLAKQKSDGLTRKLVGLELDGRRVPRHGMVVESAGAPTGVVTSGTFAPSLEKPIAMAYVAPEHGALGAMLDVVAGETRLPARVVRRPFYTRGSKKS